LFLLSLHLVSGSLDFEQKDAAPPCSSSSFLPSLPFPSFPFLSFPLAACPHLSTFAVLTVIPFSVPPPFHFVPGFRLFFSLSASCPVLTLPLSASMPYQSFAFRFPSFLLHPFFENIVDGTVVDKTIEK
jgi:hypothetical protein